MEELENVAAARLPITKIIGVGEYGEAAVRHLNAFMFKDVDFDEENRAQIKYAFSDVRVSHFVTKAILADADIVIVIADANGEEAAIEIASSAKRAKKLSVLLTNAIDDKLIAACDCALEISTLDDIENAAGVVLNPCYCIGIIGIDWIDVQRQLTEAKRGYLLTGTGETVNDAIDDALSKADSAVLRDASVACVDAICQTALTGSEADEILSIAKRLRGDCEAYFNVMLRTDADSGCKINIILADC